MRLLLIIFGSGLIFSLNPISVNTLDPLETDEEVFLADRLSAEAQTEYPNGVNVIPGEAEIDYPVYHTIPKTSFSCAGRIPGFYADVEARCQAWHNCDTDSRMQTFLCPNGTIYSQTKRVCEWWYNVNCNPTEVNRDYEQNRDLFISPRDQFPNGESKQEATVKNALISNSAPTKPVRPPQQQQQQNNYNQNQGVQRQQQQQNNNQNQGSRLQSPQHQQQQQQNYNQNQNSRPPPPQQQQQQQNYNQNQGQQHQNNFNQGSRSPPQEQQQNQNANQNQGQQQQRPQQQQQQYSQQQPRSQQSQPRPQQVPSHLSAIVQAATGAVPQSIRQQEPLPQQPRRYPGDGQNFNRPNEFQNANQNSGNQVNRNNNQIQQFDNNQNNYQQDNQQYQNQDNQQNSNRGQQQNRQNVDVNQEQRQQQPQQQRRPIPEERPIPQASRPLQNSAPVNRSPSPPPQQQQQQQNVVRQEAPRPSNKQNPTPAPQAFFIPPQMRFRHSTPRKHNIKFSSGRQFQDDENRERQIPSESQQQGFPYSQISPQTYSRNFNEFLIPSNPYTIPNEQQYREPPTTFPSPIPEVPHRQQQQRSRPTEVVPSPQHQQQQQRQEIPTGRQVPQRQNLQRSRGQVPSRESYQPEQRPTKEVPRPTPTTVRTTVAPRRIPGPETATTYRPNPASASRIVVKSRLENKQQPHEVRDSRSRDTPAPITNRPIPQYPAPLDSSAEEEAAIHSQYISGGKTYGNKQ